MVFQLPASLAARVRGFAAQQCTTPFIVMLAAFKVLLARYSRQNDVVVGTPYANRWVLAVG